jgi:hypothetical protein
MFHTFLICSPLHFPITAGLQRWWCEGPNHRWKCWHHLDLSGRWVQSIGSSGCLTVKISIRTCNSGFYLLCATCTVQICTMLFLEILHVFSWHTFMIITGPSCPLIDLIFQATRILYKNLKMSFSVLYFVDSAYAIFCLLSNYFTLHGSRWFDQIIAFLSFTSFSETWWLLPIWVSGGGSISCL